MTEAERERAIHVLRERYTRGELSDAAFEDALGALFAAETCAEVRAVLQPAPDGGAQTSMRLISVSGGDLGAIERHLLADEHVEWAGRPDPSRHLNRADAFLVPFSLLWGGFAIFWEAGAIAGRAPVVFDLFGIPFVATGLYFIAGRFVYKANRKRRTIYAVTNRRVMSIVRGRRRESVNTASVFSIPSISTEVGADGRGSVEFGSAPPGARFAPNTGMELFARGQTSSALVGFYDIDDPAGVADLVERLRRSG